MVTAHSAATELIGKVKALGAPKLDEHNKTHLATIYIFRAGTRARRALRRGRSVFARLKGRHEASSRSGAERAHRAIAGANRAQRVVPNHIRHSFPGESNPSQRSMDDGNEIEYIDSLTQRRVGSSRRYDGFACGAMPDGGFMVPSSSIRDPQLNAGEAIALAMARFTQWSPQQEDRTPIQMLAQRENMQPKGKPMRSLPSIQQGPYAVVPRGGGPSGLLAAPSAAVSSASVATPSTSTSCSELCRAPPSAPLEGQAVFALTDGPGATPNTPDHDKPEDNLARVAKRMHDRKLRAAEKASEHNSSEPDDGDKVLKRPATIKAGERDVAIACPVPDGPRRAWRFAQDHLCGGGVREESLARNARLTLQDKGRARGAPHGCLRLNFSRRGCRSTALGALRWERP